MSELELLRNARARIAKRGAWCRNFSAKDRNGVVVAVKDPAAAKWCALGAVVAETHGRGVREKAVRKLDFTAGELFGKSLTDVNDRMRKKDVLLVYDTVIERLEAKG